METYESMWTPHMWLLNIQLKNFGHSYSQMSCNLRKHQQIDHAKQTNTQTKTKENGKKNDVNRKKMLQKKKSQVSPTHSMNVKSSTKQWRKLVKIIVVKHSTPQVIILLYSHTISNLLQANAWVSNRAHWSELASQVQWLCTKVWTFQRRMRGLFFPLTVFLLKNTLPTACLTTRQQQHD